MAISLTDLSSVSGNAYWQTWSATSGTNLPYVVYGEPVLAQAEDRLLTPTEWLRRRVEEVCEEARA